MLDCSLGSDADLAWALRRVKEGHQVRVLVPKPAGTSSQQSRQARLAYRRLAAARTRAQVSELDFRVLRRWGRREFCVLQFVLSPRSPEDPSGVREPRRPREPLPALSACVAFGEHERPDLE